MLTDWHGNQVDEALVHDKKYGYFLQITDTHLDDHYTEGATLKSGCHSIPKKHLHSKHKQLCNVMGVPGVRMDAPSILIEHTLDWIKREWRDKLDFVIWTGDNSRHDWDEAHPRKETKVLELNRQVTQMMSDLFCSSPEHPRAIPVVPVIGNNDVQPHNYIALNDDVLYFFEKLWDHWIPKKQRKDFLEGGYFAVDVAPGLRVLSINTMFFLKKNPLAKSCSKKSSSGHHHMKWYKQQLRKARHDNVKVYVIGHVPPSPRDFFKSCMTDYMSITADYSDVVHGHFYGHLNMDHFLLYDKREQEIHNSEELQLPYLEDSIEEQHDTASIQRNVREYVDWLKGMYDEIDEFENKHPDRHDQFHQKPITGKKPKNFDPEPVVVVHIAPSVFPVYMPSVRIYRYEYRDSPQQGATHTYGTLLGYSQYVANISRYNEEDGHKDPKPPLNFDLEYDTKTLYGLPDLSVDAYIEFADALTQNDTESKQLWNTYCKNIFLQTLNSTFDNL
ncbi:Metallo-dependent phosphatase-like protein [Mucor lusitanicus]|uniref:Metallo-dependent phosphatase-like protein n=2 Tax=Mucor circinelloides f. lusitanicus TaxID=29924 RepID=A0A8H4BGC8_MUCCL|nr:Metallo-dependent phosphatase-like protein [Mucor lusitanicus]